MTVQFPPAAICVKPWIIPNFTVPTNHRQHGDRLRQRSGGADGRHLPEQRLLGALDHGGYRGSHPRSPSRRDRPGSRRL